MQAGNLKNLNSIRKTFFLNSSLRCNQTMSNYDRNMYFLSKTDNTESVKLN